MATELEKRMAKLYEEKVEGALLKRVRLTAFHVYSELVFNTPVGNPALWKTKYPPAGYVGGRARANWNIDVNTIDMRVTAKTQAPDVSEALAVTTKYKVNDTIYISNALPYIQRLNDGWSTQAPANFIEAAIAVGKRKGAEIGVQ